MNPLNLGKNEGVKLKGCPFCGSRNLEILANVIVCEDCEAHGPCSQEGPECVVSPSIRDDDWNRRHDETSSEFERLAK